MSGKPRIVIPDDCPPVFAGTVALARLREIGEVVVHDTLAPRPEDVWQRCRGFEVMVNIRSKTPLSAAVLEGLPDLRLIAVFGAGTDNIDLDAATRLGIAVCNAPGANARSVAEHAIALLFAVARTIPALDRQVRGGGWEKATGVELDGKTLGVLGLGAIGGHVARMGAGLGMRVLAWSRSNDPDRAARLGVEQVELHDLLRRSDAVAICAALAPETRGLIGAAELAAMKPDAMLVNVSRGPIVDEPALLMALRNGRLRGAGLDVFDVEPLPADSPFLALDNVVLSPHAAWATDDAQARLLQSPVDNITAFLAGRPQNLCNPGVSTRG